MRIITVNVNGIRSAARKGFFEWLQRQQADFVCLQETRIQPSQREDAMFSPAGYETRYGDAERPGYSGVALFCRKKPDRIIEGLGWPDFDSEGRWVQADYGRLSVVSLYLPSGSSREDRQVFKYELMDRFKPLLKKWASSGREFIICGDINIAHKEIDLKNWRSNQKNSGFLPEERAWMDWWFSDGGMVDVFREIEPGPDQFTWWSNRGQAWAKNVGWRIDYQIATPQIAKRAYAVEIFKEARFSDHAPLIIDYRVSDRWLRSQG
jgi:exodeoxyribonuclease-3